MIKTNIKMIVTPEESKQVQEICFANGIGWVTNGKHIQHTDKQFLYIADTLSYEVVEYFFKSKYHTEVSANLFIRTNGTCVEDILSKTYKELEEETMEKNEVESYADNLEYLSDFWNKEETMEKNEVESYADVKDYLIAKGLYERVLDIDWDCVEDGVFSGLFKWSETKEGYNLWNNLNNNLRRLEIYNRVESLVQDYKTKQGKEFIEHLEAQPEEAVEAKPLEKPKQYLCYVQSKALPKHIHKTLEQAKQEAQRLCRKELTEVMVLEVVSKYQAKVIVEEV